MLRIAFVVAVALTVQGTKWRDISSGENGMNTVGKYCYGYNPEDNSDAVSYAGQIDLDLSYDKEFEKPTIQVAIFDDQSDSWGAITPSMSCEDRLTHAKHTFPVTWAETTPGSQIWKWTMSHVELKEHVEPREWYVVVASCGDRFTEVGANLKFTPSSGVYSQYTGPAQCNPIVNKVPEVFMAVILVFFVSTSLCLGFLACYFTKRQSRMMNRLPAGLPDYDAPAIDMQNV
jgi:hypothetical protein